MGEEGERGVVTVVVWERGEGVRVDTQHCDVAPVWACVMVGCGCDDFARGRGGEGNINEHVT
jgi:hypothetical protein